MTYYCLCVYSADWIMCIVVWWMIDSAHISALGADIKITGLVAEEPPETLVSGGESFNLSSSEPPAEFSKNSHES